MNFFRGSSSYSWGWGMTSFPKEQDSDSEEGGDALALVSDSPSTPFEGGRSSSSSSSSRRGESSVLSAVLDDATTAHEVLTAEKPEDGPKKSRGVTCAECEDMEAIYRCDTCGDVLCQICFDMLHRKGSRASHAAKKIDAETYEQLLSGASAVKGNSELRRSSERMPANYVESKSLPPSSDSSAAIVQTLTGPDPVDHPKPPAQDRVADDQDDDDEDDDHDEEGEEESSSSSDDLPPNPNRPTAVTHYKTTVYRGSNYYRQRQEEEQAEQMRRMQAQAKALSSSEEAKRQASFLAERTKFIPLRLTLKERKALRLLESVLTVTEYTDKIDRSDWRTLAHRTRAQLQDICALMSGLVVSANYEMGQRVLADRNFKANAEFFRTILEIGRRHKIMNPEKMRSEYGKLIYILMDAAQPKIQELFEFSLVKPVRTVYSLFEERGILRILEDPYFQHAVMEIQPHGKSRPQIDREIAMKERAQNYLSRQYASSKITPEEIKQALYSVGDNHSYLAYNRDPIAGMIVLLERFFDPKKGPIDPKYSLGIVAGEDGARLTHSHERQYTYVLQSLTLWCEITNDMFRLWYLGEQDLLDGENPYQLRDTGQGLHRVQQAPRIWKAMQGLLHTTQQRVGTWVGSAVVHLGDANVPNALMFIDKYTQISRILNPIVLTLKEINEFAKQPGLAEYLDSAFGGPEAAQKLILADFFRHGFDGSGADNFFDAGSCIDGRLTSAWNWCSQIEAKPFYPLFKLAGFLGFDGSEGFQK